MTDKPDWEAIQRFLEPMPPLYCFPPGQEIVLWDGTRRPIEDVRMEDRVLNGVDSGTVTHLHHRDYSGSLRSISTTGGLSLVATHGHKVPACSSRPVEKRDFSNEVEVQFLNVGDWLLCQYSTEVANSPILTSQHLTNPYFHVDGTVSESFVHATGRGGSTTKSHQYPPLPEKLELNADLAVILGLYLADGSLDSPNKAGMPRLVSFTLGSHETEYVERLSEALFNVTGLPVKVYEGHGDCVSVRISSGTLASLLQSLCGKYANKKNIHHALLIANPAWQSQLLDWMIAGDGSRSNGTTTYVTCNGALANQVHHLALRSLSAIPTLAEYPNSGGPSDRGKIGSIFHISWATAQHSRLLGRCRLEDGFYSVRIKGVNDSQYSGPVHNLEVLPNNKYSVAGIVVNNCPHEPFPKQKVFLRSNAKEALFGGRAGGGKAGRCPDRAQPWYTPDMETSIITPNGPKLLGDIQVGDKVCNPDGSVQEVVAVHEQGQKQFYRVTLMDGSTTEASEDHLWAVWTSGRRKNAKHPVPVVPVGLKPQDEWNLRNIQRCTIVTTARLREMVLDASKRSEVGRAYHVQLPLTNPVKMTRPKGRWPVLPSYTLGVLLGDGCITNTTTPSFCGEDPEIAGIVENELRELFQDENWSLGKVDRPGTDFSVYRFGGYANDVRERLATDKLLGTYSHSKFIPERLKAAPVADRFAVIQGLFDTDGYMDDRGHVEYTTVSSQLAIDVQYMLRSLGFKATMGEKVGSYRDDDGNKVECRKVYRLYVQGNRKEELFRLNRKRERIMPWNGGQGDTLAGHRVVSVEPTAVDNARCISVSHPNSLYVTDDFIVTHNSDALLMAALQWVHVPGYTAILFRNTYADLALPGALMDRAKEWFSEYPELKSTDKGQKWVFPSGATIVFGYLDKPDDHLRYKGMEAQFIGFDEVTEMREQHYKYLFSRMRKPSVESGHPLAKVPIRARSATNPAPNWVRTRFIEEGKEKGRIFVSSGHRDNPFINHEDYEESLKNLDAVDYARLADGDWYADEPGAYFERDWFKIVNYEDLPEQALANRVRYWDTASTEVHEGNKDPDWTAGALCSLYQGFLFIHDIQHFRADPYGVEKRISRTALEDGPEVKIRMEKEPGASGKIVIDHYARHILLGYDFDGHPAIKNKESRFATWRGHARKGNVILVKNGQSRWHQDFLEEATTYGAVTEAHDDQLDSVSGAWEILTGIGGGGKKTLEIIV